MPLLLLLILTEHRPTYTGVLGTFPADIPLPPTPPAEEAPNSSQGVGVCHDAGLVDQALEHL